MEFSHLRPRFHSLCGLEMFRVLILARLYLTTLALKIGGLNVKSAIFFSWRMKLIEIEYDIFSLPGSFTNFMVVFIDFSTMNPVCVHVNFQYLKDIEKILPFDICQS